ncbi:hypothetical protein LHP98_14085 [Rhodobacter sp. Har01]|uniref:hypothetical protein n=1 Tax=Rhodobacter sp. Har01 TaxID=2883999 RepID=UPI001D060671|nr:hypothetical protein [Rhodobacter sp. Har01]MCB6179252.1 hypothetical protein [Rhodobacter sp. Har01]
MNPLTIYQARLDVVSAAVLSGDFAAYIACIDLPYLLRTAEADFVLRTADEMDQVFRMVSGALARRGVTHYERVARDALFQRPDRIEGWHFTHMIADGERIAAPHAARQVLVRRGEVWLFSEAGYPLQAAEWPIPEAALFGSKAAQLPGLGSLALDA